NNASVAHSRLLRSSALVACGIDEIETAASAFRWWEGLALRQRHLLPLSAPRPAFDILAAEGHRLPRFETTALCHHLSFPPAQARGRRRAAVRNARFSARNRVRTTCAISS